MLVEVQQRPVMSGGSSVFRTSHLREAVMFVDHTSEASELLACCSYIPSSAEWEHELHGGQPLS